MSKLFLRGRLGESLTFDLELFGIEPVQLNGLRKVAKAWFTHPVVGEFPRLFSMTSNKIAIPAAIYRSAPGPGPESAPRSVFLSNFGHLPRSAPRVLFECFLAFFWPTKCQKTLKKHSSGHSEAGAQNCSKSTPWGTFRPGPRSTPVNGGRDRNNKI